MAEQTPTTGFNQKLEENITCGVCFQRYTNPKVLICHHSFCTTCIEHLPQELEQDKYVVSCPSCRCITQLPDSGVVGLPAAFHINNILELQAILEKGQPNDTEQSKTAPVSIPLNKIDTPHSQVDLSPVPLPSREPKLPNDHVDDHSMSQYYHSLVEAKMGALTILLVDVNETLEDSNILLDSLKMFLSLHQELRNDVRSAKSLKDGMIVVGDYTSLINTKYLQAVAENFQLKVAIDLIKKFDDSIDKFCKTMPIKYLYGQDLMRQSRKRLQESEEVEFVLEWDSDETTLSDIPSLLIKAFRIEARHVIVKVVNEGNCIIVTCYAPPHLHKQLKILVKDNEAYLRKEKVLCVTIGGEIVLNRDMEDQLSLQEHMKDKPPFEKVSKDEIDLPKQSTTTPASIHLKEIGQPNDSEQSKTAPVSIPLNKIDRQHLVKAMKDGFVQSHITKAVIQGAARAGKTSLKSLILSLPYKELSTPCIEAPDIAVGTLSVNRFLQSGKCWTCVNNQDMEEKILAELQMIALKEEPSSIIFPKIPSSAVSPRLKEDDQEMSQNDIDVSSEFPVTPGQTEDVEEAVALIQELFDRCSKGIKAQELSLHERWLYFTDCGGQIQFQKLLPAFLPCASALMLVINLAEDLSGPASTQMCLETGHINVSEHSPKVDEMLKQLLVMVNSSSQQQKAIIENDRILSKYITPPDSLSIMAIATHRDEYDGKSETIEDKEEKLRNILKSVEGKICYQNKAQFKILHEVDGRNAKNGIFDDPVVEEIAFKLREQAYIVKVPLKWYCFQTLIQKVALNRCGVLNLSLCKVFGHKLGMSDDEVVSAIKFFHILNSMLYYPESGADDIVFANLHCLIDIINELMVTSCNARHLNIYPNSDIKLLAMEGIASIDFIKHMETCSNILKSFPHFTEKLLAIFQHLLIAVKVRNNEDQFFIPALLPVCDTTDINPFPESTIPPMLFYFKKGLPMGLFCSIIVHLLSRKWSIIRNRNTINYSNFMIIQPLKMKGKFAIMETPYYIQLLSEFADNIVTVRVAIHMSIEAAIKGNVKPEPGFFCPCPREPRNHIAVVRQRHPTLLQCCETNKILEDTEGQPRLAWYEVFPEEETFEDAETEKNIQAFQDEKNIQAFQDAVKKHKSLPMYMAQCMPFGPPRVGKTCLLNRLLNKPVLGTPATRDALGSAANSTIALDKRRVIYSTVIAEGGEWKEIENLEEESAVLVNSVDLIIPSDVNEPTEHVDSSMEHVDVAKSFTPTNTLSKGGNDFISQQNPDENITSHSNDLEAGHFRYDDPIRAAVTSDDSVTRRTDTGSNLLRELLESIKHKDMSKVEKLLKDTLTIFYTDTGGQPEFQEVLPALVAGPTIFVLIFNLAKGLGARYTVTYRTSNEESNRYESSFTVKNVFMQCLSSIASYHNALSQDVALRNSKCHVPPLSVLVVATHKDLVTKEEMIEIDKKLKEAVKPTSLFRNGCIEYCPDVKDQLVIPVDNYNEKNDDSTSVRKVVENIIKRKKGGEESPYKIIFPVNWLALEWWLRNMNKSTVTYGECIQIAEKCSISEKDLRACLLFLHHQTGTIRYYHRIEELKNTIIIQPSAIFEAVSELITYTFAGENVDQPEIQAFKTLGLFKRGTFESIFVKHQDKLQISCDAFLALLNYLNILGPVHDPDHDYDYFLPCALVHAPEPPSSEIPLDPLLVLFEGGFVPKGIFSALLAYLVRKMKWRVQLRKEIPLLYRNQASFFTGRKGDNGPVTLKVTSEHFEINNNADGTMHCYNIWRNLKEGIINVCKSLRYGKSFCTQTFGFYCSLPECEEDGKHIAEVDLEEMEIKCRFTAKIYPVSKERKHWFKGCEDVQFTQAHTKMDIEFSTKRPHEDIIESRETLLTDDTPILKKSPNSSEVFDLIKCHSAIWDEFGIALRVPHDTRESLRHDVALSCLSRLNRVVEKWIQSQCSPVTWENVIDTLLSMDLKTTADEVQDYLKHRQVITKSSLESTSKPVAYDEKDALSNKTEGCEDVQFAQAHTKMDIEFSMKRPHEDVVESNKKRKEDQHITPECVGQKRCREDNYDSLKIPKLDIQGPVPLSSHGLSKPDQDAVHQTEIKSSVSQTLEATGTHRANVDTSQVIRCIELVMQKNHANLTRLFKTGSLKTVADELLEAGIITRDVQTNPTSDTIINCFLSGFAFKNELEEIEEYCVRFFNTFYEIRGPYVDAANKIKKSIQESVRDKLGIQLNV